MSGWLLSQVLLFEACQDGFKPSQLPCRGGVTLIQSLSDQLLDQLPRSPPRAPEAWVQKGGPAVAFASTGGQGNLFPGRGGLPRWRLAGGSVGKGWGPGTCGHAFVVR